MRSSIFLLATAIGLAAAQCNQGQLTNCVNNMETSVTACKDVACICSAIKTGLACYSTYCPSVTIPAEVTSQYNSYCSGPLPTETFDLSSILSVETGTATATGAAITHSTSPAAGTLSTIASAPTSLSAGTGTTSTGAGPGTTSTGAGTGTTSTGVQAQQTTASKAAAEVLLVPAGGLVAGLVGVLALL